MFLFSDVVTFLRKRGYFRGKSDSTLMVFMCDVLFPKNLLKTAEK